MRTRPPASLWRLPLAGVLLSLATIVVAQHNRIDQIGPFAPELAAFGRHDIGVRSLTVTDPDRVDVLNTPRGGDTAYYDRSLTLEIWYPAELSGQAPGGEYRVVTRNPAITATLSGRAVRDAAPLQSGGPWPLVILSHGYPGNRFLLSHLGENLASKGYVVASIDHTESTYDDQQPFPSTLYNRPLDQRFVLQELAEQSAASGGFLAGLVDAGRSGLIGYSMGGYGLLNNLGAGYSDDIVGSFMAPPNRLLAEHASGDPRYRENLDGRIRAGVALAPWGMEAGFWRTEDLAGITLPLLTIAGEADATAGYEEGPRAIWEAALNSDRYLLTFKNGGHHAGAPIPVPAELLDSEGQSGASHYSDPVWDTVTANNIVQHFITAFFDAHLKGEQAKLDYLDLEEDGAEAVYAIVNGRAQPQHNYWRGFGRGTAVGLKLEHRAAQ